MLQKNINNTGRLLRLVIAILLLIFAVWQRSWIAGVFGIFTLIEAYFSWCVLYQLMGWNSCPIDKQKK
jgi:predicted RND superfamily exporter protein